MKKQLIFDLFQDLVVGLSITLTVSLRLNAFSTFGGFVLDWMIAFLINYAVGLIIPTFKIASFFAKLMKVEEKSRIFGVIITLVNSIVFVTVISVAMFAIKIGFNPMFLTALLRTYPFTLPVAFVVGYLMSPLSRLLADKLVKK